MVMLPRIAEDKKALAPQPARAKLLRFQRKKSASQRKHKSHRSCVKICKEMSALTDMRPRGFMPEIPMG